MKFRKAVLLALLCSVSVNAISADLPLKLPYTINVRDAENTGKRMFEVDHLPWIKLYQLIGVLSDKRVIIRTKLRKGTVSVRIQGKSWDEIMQIIIDSQEDLTLEITEDAYIVRKK